MTQTYWWTQKTNFGDQLNKNILELAGIRPVLSHVEDAELVAIGSVLEHLPDDWHGRWIAGSGKIREDSVVRPGSAKILALRGPLTAKGVPGDYAVGDLGLLASELVPLQRKTHDLGLLPHWRDPQLIHRPEFLRYNPLIINPTDDVLRVTAQIASCRKIVTSSLHGLVVADAFHVARRFEPAPALRTRAEGDLFKFRDYHASIKMKFEPGVTARPYWNHVEDRQNELWDVLNELGRLCRD